jgi:hypothetical protein
MSGYCGLPISFARHLWVVVNNKGKVSRWEVLIQKNCCGKSWGHLHLNSRDPFEPLGLFSMLGKSLIKADVLGFCEGNTGSIAEKMIQLIESSPTLYPFCEEYSLLSPNSNSYVSWVLHHFPEVNIQLPWNAFGKGYEFAK